jgi:hypothetical protein
MTVLANVFHCLFELRLTELLLRLKAALVSSKKPSSSVLFALKSVTDRVFSSCGFLEITKSVLKMTMRYAYPLPSGLGLA